VAPITRLPRELSGAEQELVTQSNAFARNLLRRLLEANPDSTVFVSPLSASMALAMTMNGAAGETRRQIEGVLGSAGLSPRDINAAYRDLIALLRGLDPRVDFRLANAIFHRSSFSLEPPFLEFVRAHFDARIEGLDFDDPGAADRINAWVRSATGGRIDRMVEPPIDSRTMGLLMNAIYFKGEWRGRFDPRATYTGPFRLEGGGTSPVRFMTRRAELPYRASERWHAVEIPYGGGAWVMTVAVPRGSESLDAVVVDLETLLDPAVAWPEREVIVHVPRFELQWERTLNDDLIALGMADAFDEHAADFTPMYARAREVQLHVSRVKQKTFLRVDEEGTEAAAVTSVEMQVTSVRDEPPEVRADRPFFLAIRERLSGTVVFSGLIVQAPGD
jgi:serpin B